MFGHNPSITVLIIVLSLLHANTARADSEFNVYVKVNDIVVQSKLKFSRELYFVAEFPFDFLKLGTNTVRSLEVNSDQIPAGYLTASHNIFEGKLTVALDYPDPLYGPLALDTINQFEVTLLLENESLEIIQQILAGLGAKGRLTLLGNVGQALSEQQFIRYEDALLSAIVHGGLQTKMDAAVQLLSKFTFAKVDKLAIARMVLGYANRDDIIAMQNLISENEELQCFVDNLRLHIGTNDIIDYLFTRHQ